MYKRQALGALPPAPLPPGTTGAAFAADGARLCYPPAWVLATYRKNRRYLPRAYLHSVLPVSYTHLALWIFNVRKRKSNKPCRLTLPAMTPVRR